MTSTRADQSLQIQIKGGRFPAPQTEFVFHAKRKWRLDYAWPHERIALEIDGGIWMGKGAHAGGTAISRDMEKHNEAALLGWLVLRATPSQIVKGEAFDLLQRAFALRAEEATA